MSKVSQYKLMVLAGFILWIGETAYFGWNDRPENNIEKMLDIVSQVLIVWGILGDLLQNLTIQKNTTINTKKVKVVFTPNKTDDK